MTWPQVVWLTITTACLTLAVVHAHVWLRNRRAVANAAFAVLVVSVAAMGYVELRMMRATTVAEFSRWLWQYQLPVWTGMVAMIWFVRHYLHAGRAWLAWTAIGLRTLTLVINAFSSPSIHFREIVSVAPVTIFGEPFAVAQGVPNPWMVVAHLSLLFLVLFVADAIRDLWRRGEWRRAVTIGGSIVLFVAAGTLVVMLSFWGVARIPIFATLFFTPIVLAMGFELSGDLIRSAKLAADLDVKTVELRESEQKLSLAADAGSAGLWSVDSATGRLWATPRALDMFALARDREHRVDDVLRSIHPDDRERVHAFARGEKQLDPASESIEYRVLHPGGAVRWYASRGRTQDGEATAPRRLMGATVDITDRKRAEDETASQRSELEHLARVAMVSELSGALAHELNQPLAIIMSNAEAAQKLLERSPPDIAEVRAIVSDIIAADERAGEVIRRLRSLLKRGGPNRQPLSLNETVQEVLQFMRADLIRRGVVVDLALAGGLPPILADRVPLEQVLINIVANACDALADNAPGDRTISIATRADEDTVDVRIRDAGSGLPADPDSIFAPFFTTKEQGLGLGLAICRSIVSAHGGSLRVEANADRGATLHLSLPIMVEAT